MQTETAVKLTIFASNKCSLTIVHSIYLFLLNKRKLDIIPPTCNPKMATINKTQIEELTL